MNTLRYLQPFCLLNVGDVFWTLKWRFVQRIIKYDRDSEGLRKRAANGKFKVIQMKPAYVHFNASAFFPQDSQRSCENLNSALYTRKAISSPKTNHSLGTTANDSEILNSILQKWLINTSFTQKGSYRKTLFHLTPSWRRATNPSASQYSLDNTKLPCYTLSPTQLCASAPLRLCAYPLRDMRHKENVRVSLWHSKFYGWGIMEFLTFEWQRISRKLRHESNSVWALALSWRYIAVGIEFARG